MAKTKKNSTHREGDRDGDGKTVRDSERDRETERQRETEREREGCANWNKGLATAFSA